MRQCKKGGLKAAACCVLGVTAELAAVINQLINPYAQCAGDLLEANRQNLCSVNSYRQIL